MPSCGPLAYVETPVYLQKSAVKHQIYIHGPTNYSNKTSSATSQAHLLGLAPPTLSGPPCTSSVLKLAGSGSLGGAAGRLICSRSWLSCCCWLRLTTSRPLSVSNLRAGAELPHSAQMGTHRCQQPATPFNDCAETWAQVPWYSW